MGEGTVLSHEGTTTPQSFIGIWELIIHELRTDDGGVRFTTAESYECALKSFRKILGTDMVKGFCISAAELQIWKEGMHNGVKDENGTIVGKSVIRQLESICVAAVLYGIVAYTRASLKMFLILSPIRKRKGL